MSVMEIFSLNVPQGEVAIAWINSYSAIVIKTAQATLVFDPVSIDPGKHFQADVIIITHEHYDHFSPALVKKLYMKTKAPIVTTQFAAQRLEGIDTRILNVGEHFSIKDFEIHGMHCEHAANKPLSFMISVQNRIRIFHPSDSRPFPEMARIGKMHKPHILLYSGNSLENAAQIAKLIKPRVVVSYFTDGESQKRFISLIRASTPTTQARMIRQFEIYRYPD
ncbi:MAG: MBL fold metallo-hydrolase [Thermodesulfobacteriota bacterium]|nr:MBL fold metallo-hydrolase [Thermodesulfobacteriota bacterium]